MTATVVLVHGAWHGAWCWSPIESRLAELGIATVAVDLPGCGHDATRLGDLYADADTVTAAIAATSGPVVLVGHSYGGVVITDAGHHERVKELVYVTAFAVAEDESLVNAAATEAADANVETPSVGLADAMVVNDNGTATLKPESVGALLYNECDLATQQWAAERVAPQNLVNTAQPVRNVAWRDRPSTYVVCERDRAIVPAFQRVLAARCSHQVVLDADHSPFASTPDELSRVLAEIAARY